MRPAVKVTVLVLAIPLLIVTWTVAIDVALQYRATPPRSVTDIASFLEWNEHPMRALRITSDETVYYQFLGPAGRFFNSGPAGYTFDAQGAFIGWSDDIGDFESPPEVFRPGATREVISLEELLRQF